MARGLRAKNEGVLDENQLWASLALELLAKSSLSNLHPALVADPTHYQSLFSACGHPLSPDVKTYMVSSRFARFDYTLTTYLGCGHISGFLNEGLSLPL